MVLSLSGRRLVKSLPDQVSHPETGSRATSDEQATVRLDRSVEKIAPPAIAAVLSVSVSCVELAAEQRLLRGRSRAAKTYRLSGFPSAKSQSLLHNQDSLSFIYHCDHTVGSICGSAYNHQYR